MKWLFNKFSGDAKHQKQLRDAGLKPTLLLTNEGQAIVIDNLGNRVCLVDMQAKAKRMDRWKSDCPARDLNARLIASSPELLEIARNVSEGKMVWTEQDMKAVNDLIDYIDHGINVP